MGGSRWFGLVGQILRLLAVLALLLILLPRLFSACISLYSSLLQRDRVPSGNPLKVEAPVPESDEFVFKLRGLP